MKTKMKNRILSAVLALTMVASLLPAGLITPASAADYVTAGHVIVDAPAGSSGKFSLTMRSPTGGAGNLGNHVFLLIPDVSSNGQAFVPSKQAGTSNMAGNYASVAGIKTSLSAIGAVAPDGYLWDTETNERYPSSGNAPFSGTMGTKFEAAVKELIGYTDRDGHTYTGTETTIPMVAILWSGVGPTLSWTTTVWDSSELKLKKQSDINTEMGGTNASLVPINEDVLVDATGGDGTLASISLTITNSSGQEVRGEFTVTLSDGGTPIANGGALTKDKTYTLNLSSSSAAIAGANGPYTGQILINYKTAAGDPKSETVDVTIAPTVGAATGISYSPIEVTVLQGTTTIVGTPTGGDPTCTWMISSISGQKGRRPEAMYTATDTQPLGGTYTTLTAPLTTGGVPTRIAQVEQRKGRPNPNTNAGYEAAYPPVYIQEPISLAGQLSLQAAVASLPVGDHSDTLTLGYFTQGSTGTGTAVTVPTAEAATGIKIATIPVIIHVVAADSATFRGMGGTWTEGSSTVGSKTVVIANPSGNRSVTPPATDPVKSGFTFKGWAKQGTTTIIASWPQTGVANGQIYDAIWEEEKTDYKITFTAGSGGSLSASSWTGTDPTAAFTWPTATASSGKLFKGWYTASTGGTKIDHSSVDTWNGLDGVSGISKSDTTITVYAQWVDEYTITFNSNGGTPTTAQTKKTGVDGKITSSPTNPSRSSYTFLGWFDTKAHADAATSTSSAGYIADVANEVHTGNATRYAAWTQNTYTVIVNLKKDGQNYASSGKTVWLSADGSTFLPTAGVAANASTGAASLTGIPDGTYTVYVGTNASDRATTNVTVKVNGANNSATVNYYTVNAAKGANADTVYVSASSTMGTDTTLVFLEGATAYLEAKPIATYAGDSATWTFTDPTPAGGTRPTAPSGKTNTHSFTVTGSVTATAKYTTEATYTAKIYFLKNGTAGQYVTSGVTKVDLATAADGTTGAVGMSKDSTNGGLWTASVSASSTYSHVTVTVDGGTYVVPLATAIKFTDNEEENVPLYLITLKTATTVSGSATPWGSATVSVGTKGTPADKTASDATGIEFYVPNVTNAITLKSTTPATNYVDRDTHNWSNDGGSNINRDTGYKFAPSAATTIIAYFTPHGKLVFSPSPITVSKREGYPTQNIVEESTTGTDTKGYLKNEGPADVPGITYSFAVDSTGASWPSGKGPADFLKLTKSPTDLTKAGGATDWSGVVVQMLAGLPQNANPYKAKLTISSSDDNVDDVVVEISITINEASGIEFDPAGYTWDTYTETISPDGVNAGTNKTWSTVLGLINLKSVKSIKVGSITLEPGAGKDYTLSAITQGATDDAPDTITVSFTTAGLKKIAGEVTPGSQGALVVTADDNDGGVKVATIPAKLIDTMPKLTKAVFDNVDTSNGNAWALGSSPAPDLKVTDSNNKTTPSLTGAVTYEWSVNGQVKDGWKDKANLTATELATLSVGDTVTVKATGTGAAWAAKPGTSTDLYKDTVSVSASFKVALPEVTVKITLDGSAYTAPGSGDKITASSTDLGSGLLLQTDSTNAKKYAFKNWTMEDNSTGNFSMSGTATTTTNATTAFKPVKAATVVANWVSIATVEYTNGPAAVGPNDAAKSQYSDTLVNNGAKVTTISKMELTGADAGKFDLTTTVSGNLAAGATSSAFVVKPKSTTGAGTYTFVVKTTYTDGKLKADGTYDSATVEQTVVYTVPEPTFVITLVTTTGGTNRGNYKGANTDATTSANNKTVDVTKGDSIALTGIADAGYKFVNWTLGTTAGSTDDKLGNATTDYSNAYGGVTKAQTITANFKAVTDLSEANTKTSASANIGYSAAVDVYTGTVTNAGALAANVTYAITDVKKDGAAASSADAGKFSVTPNGATTIAAATAPGTTNTDQAVTVKAAAGLGVGTYTLKLTITETTGDDNTMAGKNFVKEVYLTFTVGGGSAEIEVKLNAAYKNAETVTLLHPTDGSTITATAPTSGNKYTATGLATGVAYKILVNGVDSTETVTAANATTPASATVQLWTLSVTPDPTDKSKGDVSASGGTSIAVTGGTGYVDGSSVTLTAAPKTGTPGYKFVNWTDTNRNLGWTGNASTDNPKTITISAATAVVGHFDDIPAETEYVTVKYHDNKNNAPIASLAGDAVLATVTHEKNTDYIIASLTPTISGYKFVKWNTKADKSGTDYVGGNTITKLSTDLDLYAVWVADPTWPVITNGVYGDSYTWNAAATGISAYAVKNVPAASLITGNYNGLPDGLSINASTGVVTGTPAETGTYQFVLEYKDADNNTWEREYSLFIDRATPSLSGITINGVSDGAAVSSLTIDGVAKVPFATAKTTWKDSGNDIAYTYVASVGQAATATTGDAANGGGLTITSPASGNLSFGAATSLPGTVKFTPSGNATGTTGLTHQTAQKYSDIYKEVSAPCTFNLGGKTYGITVTPDQIPDGTKYTDVDIDVGGTLPTTTAWSFDVENNGNQGAHVTYELQGADKDSFVLTPTYDSKDFKGSSANDNDAIAKDDKTTGAFTVGVASTVSTTTPGVYVAQVAVKNWSVDEEGNKTLQDTVIVPIRFEVKAKDFDGAVSITLNNVSGSPQTKQPEPRNASVVFMEYDTVNSKLLSTGVTGVWTPDSAGATTGVYKGSLQTGKTYHVVVNGHDTGVTVTDATAKVVNLYQVALDVAGISDATAVSAIKALQTGPKYLAAGESGSVTTPSVYTDASSVTYDFNTAADKGWHDGTSTTSTAANYPTYTMSAGSPKAVTLTANYKTRESNQVKIHYHKNENGASTAATADVLWDQTVTKSTAATVSSTKPTRNGWGFSGWNTKADGSGTPYAAGATIPAASLGADLHLFAQWKKVSQTGDGFSAKEFSTYYSERFSESIAVTGWQDVDGAAVSAPAVKYITTDTLPGGLKLDENTGVISGRPYEVNTTGFTFNVKVVPADDVNTTLIDPITITIKVDKETPRLANAKGENATTGKDYNTADYYADVVADILKTKGMTDGKPDASKDVWEDGKTIISGGDSGLYYKASTGTVSYTTQANGGKLEPETGKNFASGSNSVELTWTPGTTTGSYPLLDGASNPWGDIFKPTTTTVGVTPGSDSRGVEVTPATIKFRVKKDSGAYEVWNGSAYVAVGGSGVTANQITAKSTGNLPVYLYWALDPSTNTYFDLTASPASAANRYELAAKDATHTLTVTAKYDDAVGTYTSEAVVTAYDKAAADGALVSTQKVTLVLEVIDADTFSFELDTYLNSLGADTTSAVAGTSALGNVTSVVFVELAADGSATSTTVNGDSSAAAGKYLASLKTDKTYKVEINGVELPGVRINKNTTSPQRADLYQLVLGHDGNGQADPTATPAGGPAGYFLPGQRVSVAAGAAKRGYTFKSWTETVEAGSGVKDTVNEDYSTTENVSYVMGDKAVKLTANYKVVGLTFKVVLDDNNGTLAYNGSENHKNVLSGGKASGADYIVDDGATFGLGMAVDTPASGQYSAKRDGYTFAGWSTNASAASGAYSFVASETLAKGDGDSKDDTITLYAIWVKDNDLALAPVTVTGVYKHAITDVYHGATGGVSPYVSYVGKDAAFGGGDTIFALTLETVTATGANQYKSKVSGTPDDVGTKVSTVTVTDSRDPANTASALYTIIIDKAEVEPNASTALPTTGTEIEVALGGDVAGAIKDVLDDIQMDGDGTSETKINGTWSIDGSLPTTAGTHTVTVTFHPTNAGTADATKDHDDTKDGNHYNTYTTTIPVVIGGKLITDADLDTTGTMAPKAGSALVYTVPTSNRSLDPNGHDGDPTYATGAADAGNDVYIADVKWTEDGVTLDRTKNPTATGGHDYALYITLKVTDATTWRFDPTEFKGSTIAGLDATAVAVNDTMAVLRVNFPKQVTIIDVGTNTPLPGATSNSVWPGTAHVNDYTIGDADYKWYPEGATSGEVGSGSGDSQVKFELGQYYDLVVTVTLKPGVSFVDAIANANVGDELGNGDGNNTNDYATANDKEPPEQTHKVTVEKAFDPDTGTITLRYNAFTPADRTLVGLLVQGAPGVYYAQTGDSSNHFKTSTSGVTGNTGSKTDVSFVFDRSKLEVYPLYLKNDGTGSEKGNKLGDNAYTIKVGATELPASFKDEYTPSGETDKRQDVTLFDGATLTVEYNGYTAAVGGTLRVQQLRADMMYVSGTVGPELRYEPGDTFTFNSSATGALTADVSFNTDVTELDNPVNGLTYARYSTLTGNPDSKTYFLEYGEDNEPTNVPHKAGDPSALDTGALLTELVPGVTQMTADMAGKTVYATYVDVNHNVVRVALGKINMATDFTVELVDINGGDPEYGDVLMGKPMIPDPKNPTGDPIPDPDPNGYTYVWQYWKPDPTKPEDPTAPDGLDKKGTWEPIPNETDRVHEPDKDEVGEWIRVAATDRDDTDTTRYSDPVKVEPRSLNFIVDPWNKAPDTTSHNIHSYTTGDFHLTDYNGVGGVVSGDNVTLTPAGTWNNAATTRPNYKKPGTAITDPNGVDVGDKIVWPAITENTTADVNKTGGYTLGGTITATSLTGKTIDSVYRLREQGQQLDRGTILAVEIIDENEHDPEYGDKLTADPKGPDGNPDPKPGLTYEWQIKDPDTGDWKPIPGETGKDHFPGKDEVGEEIRVVVTDPEDGTKRESEPLEIYPRSLNFVVERQNRVHTDDDDAKNTHPYTDADFTLTSVKKDVKDSDSDGTPDAMDAKGMLPFVVAAKTYGGVYGSDAVTLKPAETAGNWNAADATRPSYRTKTDANIADGTANGEVGSKIIWPQVFEGNNDADGAAEKAGRFTDYVLTGPTNTKGNEIYRLAPQDEQLDRGEITGGAGGSVMHVNVDFKNYPAIGAPIPNYPDAEDPNATGLDADGAPRKDTAVTDKRETRPGEVLDHANDVKPTDGKGGYPGNQYIAMWYPAITAGDGTVAKDFDPTAPTTTGGTALNAGNAATNNSNTAFTRPTGNTFSGDAATVVVKVIPRRGYQYELLGEKVNNEKTATKFHFHFSSDFTVDLPVVDKGPQGVKKVTETVGTESYDVYYMWYTFDEDAFVLPPFVAEPLDLGLTADAFLYYANTDADAPATGDHHHAVNSADNTDIPGGKKGIGFTFKLDAVKTAVDNVTNADTGVNGLSLKRTDGSTILLTAANYGSTWRLKAGPRPEAANKALDDNTSGAYEGRTFKDTVNLLGSAGGSANTGDSGNSAGDTYDGLYVYIEVTVEGHTQVYPVPLGVKEAGDTKETPVALTVKELEAESITATGTLNSLKYTNGDAFSTAGVTGASVKFNRGTAAMNVTYATTTYADGQDIDYTDATSNEGKVYFFQYLSAAPDTYAALTNGMTLNRDNHNGKPVYICYTDVNNHIVRQYLGVLIVDEEEAPDTIDRISVTYPEPVKDQKPFAADASKNTLWTWNMLDNSEKVDVSETLVAGSTYKTEGTTWYTTDLSGAPADAATIASKAIPANALADKFLADKYYLVEAKIDPKGDNLFNPNGVTVNINGVSVKVDGVMGVKYDGEVAIGWAMAESVKDGEGKVTQIIARYIAKTRDDNLVGSVSINYVTPAVPNATEDYSSYADTTAVTVPDKDDADAPTTWYKVSDTADTAYAEDTAANKLTMGTDYVSGGVYMVVNTVKANAGYKLDANTVVSVDGNKLTNGSYVNPDTDAESGLIKAQATLNADGTITVKSIYKVPAEKPNVVNSVSVTYPEPLANKEPLAKSTQDEADRTWTYEYLWNAANVSVNEDLNDATADIAKDTKGSTWYTAGDTAPTQASDFALTGKDKLKAAFAPGKFYMVEAKIEPKEKNKFADDTYVTINGIVVKAAADEASAVMMTKYDAGKAIGWAIAFKDGDNIIARYIAKTVDDELIGELSINYVTPVYDAAPANQTKYTDSTLVKVDAHDAADETTNQWYVVSAAEVDAPAVSADKMKFTGETDGPDKYAYDGYYLVKSTFKTIKEGYAMTTATTILVDGILSVVADDTTVAKTGAAKGLLSAKATLNADGTVTLLSVYKVEPEPDPEAPKEASDVFVTYRAPVTGAEPGSKPEVYGNKAQVNIADNATAWHTLPAQDTWTGGSEWTTNNAMALDGSETYAVDTWYRAESILTEVKSPAPGYAFAKDGQKIRINGIEVTVGGDAAEIKNAKDEIVGYVKAVWNNAEKTQVKAMYIAKTLDDTEVTAIAINYVTPVKNNAAAEYVTYLDKEMVTVDRYADDNTNGTKWYEVKNGTDFDNANGNAMMTLDTTKYGAGKYYVVENIVEPKDNFKLGTGTIVYVDGVEVAKDSTDTSDGYPGYVTTSNASGLVAVRKTYDAATKTIKVQTIYLVPADKPGVVNNISITYPEPQAEEEPLPNRDKSKWTWQELLNQAQVEVDETITAGKKTEGTTWYTTVLTDADIAAGLTTADFEPTHPTDATRNMTELNGTFAFDTYYMVEGEIDPKDGYVFDSEGDIYVTVNGIVVKVDDTATPCKAKYKYDEKGAEQPVGWAMAKSVKDAEGKVIQIIARYIAKTELSDSTVIYEVEGNVQKPSPDATISTTVSGKRARFEKTNADATDHVTLSAIAWSKSDSFNADGTGYTALAAGENTFQAGKYYKAVFTASADTGYTFQVVDVDNPDTPDFVAFLINNVIHAATDAVDANKWVNDKHTPDSATSAEGIKVSAKQVNGNTDEYEITVLFPLTGDKKERPIFGFADVPASKKDNAPYKVNDAQITAKAGEPYEIKNAADAYWEHWTGGAWVKVTDPNETFKAGDIYRAVLTVEIKDDQKNLYQFTETTDGYVNGDDAKSPLNNAAPASNDLKTSVRYNKTGDEVTTVTLAKEFLVPKEKIVVHVSSRVPEAGVFAYTIDKDTEIVNIDHDSERYDLVPDGGYQARWYEKDGSGYKPMGNKAFEVGKTYYLMVNADMKDDVPYAFYDVKDGYEWRDPDSGNTLVDNAKLLFDSDPKWVKDANGDTVESYVAFEYTIPELVPALIPGWAEQPVTGSPLSAIRTEDKDFTIVGEPWWTKGDKDSTEHIAPGTAAEETTTYFAHIKVKAKDGVFVKDEDIYYRFNLSTTADLNFIWHKGEKDENNEDIYYLIYQFNTTEEEPEPPTPSGGGGGGTTTVENPVVYYHLKDQGVTDDPTAEKVKKNNKPTKVPKVKPVTGLVFKGWSEVDPSTLPAGTLPTLVDPTTFKITKDKWFYAVYEKGVEVDHLHYVIGFPNGTFGPDAKITRAEVATIIARSCLEGFVEGANYGNPGNYSDVTTHWAFSAIAFCAREGVFTGYEDGTFRPDRYITRQELATVVARLAGVQTSKGVPFHDKDQIASWALNGVYTAYANGWIKGYEDGTFQPERDISRAETVKIFNGYLKRGVDAKGLEGLKEYVHTGVASNNTENGHDEYMTWPDVPKTHWAYHEIIEAANDHNYHWQDDAKQTPPEDWDEVYINEKWRYNDNAADGADKRDENMTLQKTFTVTYLVSSNGVTYDAITETVERFASPKPENLPVAVPDEGYRFAGWSATDPSTGEITLVDPTASSVTSDKWYYAVFEEDKPYTLPVYTVTYVIGDLGSYDGATVERVEMFQAPSVAGLPQPTVSEGYRLAGWSETDPATGSYTIVDPTANYVTGDKTFYAVYEKADEPYRLPVYTVTYVIGGNGSYDGATVEQVEMFQAPSVAGLPQPVANEGYKFVGWSETDSAEGGYVIMDPTANYVTSDKTFYAVYEAI